MYGNTARTFRQMEQFDESSSRVGCTGGNREICAMIDVFDLLWALKYSPDLIGFSATETIFGQSGRRQPLPPAKRIAGQPEEAGMAARQLTRTM